MKPLPMCRWLVCRAKIWRGSDGMVKLKAGKTVSEQELLDFCSSQIAYYKVPRYWKFVEGFPMTVTGKIRKVEMRETAIEELGCTMWQRSGLLSAEDFVPALQLFNSPVARLFRLKKLVKSQSLFKYPVATSAVCYGGTVFRPFNYSFILKPIWKNCLLPVCFIRIFRNSV